MVSVHVLKGLQVTEWIHLRFAVCNIAADSSHCVGEVGGAYYGIKHPMKPHRMRMTNELIIEYGLVDHLDVYVSG